MTKPAYAIYEQHWPKERNSLHIHAILAPFLFATQNNMNTLADLFIKELKKVQSWMVASLFKTVLFFSNIPVTCSHCLGFDAVGEPVFDFRLVELQILCDTYTIETQQSLNIIRYGIIGFFQTHKMDKRPMLKISKATVKISLPRATIAHLSPTCPEGQIWSFRQSRHVTPKSK